MATRAAPPNYGVLALRFPVSHLAAIEQRLRTARAGRSREGLRCSVCRPMARVRMLAVHAPRRRLARILRKDDTMSER